MTRLPQLLTLSAVLLAVPVHAQEEGEAGHMHGPDGRHVAVAETFGPSAGKSVLSHHDLMITDTGKFSMKQEGAVVKRADVHSVIHKKGDPKVVVHREHNAFEPENGVYGSHMMYREPGEYVIVENVTLPDGKKLTLEFPIWVPGPKPAGGGTSASPLLLAAGVVGAVILLLLAFILGRRSGRRSAAQVSLLAVLAGLVPYGAAHAQDDEAGHMHGPDGRHVAVAETFGAGPNEPLRAYLGPNREVEATQTRENLRFRLSIENEELAPPDADQVTLAPEAVAAVGVKTVAAVPRDVGGGLSTTGQVRPSANGTVTINSRVGGRILRLHVSPGQEVRSGQLVGVIDSTEVAEAQAALSQSQSEQRQAEAARGRAGAEVRRAESLVREAQSALDRVRAQRAEAQAEVDHERAEVEIARSKESAAAQALQRQRQLAAAGAFAQGPVETARSGVAGAEGELREAQAAMPNLEGQARRLEAGVQAGVSARKELESAQSALEQGRARIRTADRQLEIARGALAREERIQRENLRDAREVQQAQADLENARLGVKSAEAGAARQRRAVEAAEALIAAQGRAIQSAEAQVEAARADVREAAAAAAGSRMAVRSALNRVRLLGAAPGGGNQVTVTAPIGGEIHSRPVATGQVVQAGQTLATLVNTDSVWVESDVFEKDLPKVREGQRVTLATEAIPGRTFTGTISSIENEVDPTTRAVHVRTVVSNPGRLLKPNMFVRVILSGGGAPAVTIPLEALQEQGGDQVVFIQENPGVYHRRVVRVGPALGDQVVIEAGVKAGEQVVTQGAYQLLAKVRR